MLRLERRHAQGLLTITSSKTGLQSRHSSAQKTVLEIQYRNEGQRSLVGKGQLQGSSRQVKSHTCHFA